MPTIDPIQQAEETYLSAVLGRHRLFVALGRVPPDQRAGVESAYLAMRKSERECLKALRRARREAVQSFDEVA